MKTVELSDANDSLASYVRAVDDQPVVITHHGTPMAALFPIDDIDL